MPVPPAMLRGRGGSRGGGGRSSDYDYEYDIYGDYQGGYRDPYYEDYYRYEDYYYDYPPYSMGGRSRSKAPPGGRGYGMVSRGRGAVGPYPRGGRGGYIPPLRGVPMGGRMGRPMRGGRGGVRGGNLAGKRKLESGHQNEGDSKRRLQTTSTINTSTTGASDSCASGVSSHDNGDASGASWGNEPIPQQPLGRGEEQWYRDTCPQSWS